jgi:uncharacterized protein with HEPN domain
VYIVENIANVEELTAGGRDMTKHQRAALLYYLQTIAEATQRLSDQIKAAHAGMDWVAIAGFRNRLAHGYLEINMNIIWAVVETYLPELKQIVTVMLQELDALESKE